MQRYVVGLFGLVVAGLCTGAGPASAQVVPPPAGVAQATVQLPIVNVTSVLTTVTVPDQGQILLGGQSTYSANFDVINGRRQDMHRNTASTLMSATVFIHDFASMEEDLGYRLAERMRNEGKFADAIERYQGIAEKGKNPEHRRAAEARLQQLRDEGTRKYQTARRLYEVGDSVAAAQQVEKVLRDYGALIMTPAHRTQQQQIDSSPEVAEMKHGIQADVYLARAREAELSGKAEVARVYYRMAARLHGTSAGAEAARGLARIESVPERRSNDLFGTPAISQPDSPQRLVDLARLYRTTSPLKSREYYRQALQQIPAGTALFQQVAAEVRAIPLPGNAVANDR